LHDLIKFINNKTSNKYDYLKLSSAEYNRAKNLLSIAFLYPDELGAISETSKVELKNLIEKYSEMDIDIELKYIKSFYDNEYLKRLTNEFIKHEFPSIVSVIKTDNLTYKEENSVVRVSLNYIKNYITEGQLNKFKLGLKNYFNKQFSYLFEVDITATEEKQKLSLLAQKEKEILDNMTTDEVKPKTVKVEVISQIIGSETSVTPLSVSSVLVPDKNLSICGTIKYLSEREFTKKQKVLDSEVEKYAEVKKTFYSFTIESAGKEMNAVYFPNKNTIEKAKLLENKMEVVLTGDVEEFNGKLSFKIKHITKVKIMEKLVEEVKYKPVPKNYILVKPEAYEAVGQASLFEAFDEPNEYIKNNTFIVFDTETTGLSHEDCKITEIGGVKIENGKVINKFSTLIDPEVEIPLFITKITGITDAMVMGAPKIETVISDFYKYCEGSTLVAYNIDFDYKFINYNAKQFGFDFDHPQMDALVMARKYIKGLRNYKLKTVCEALGVSLNNAHRAYNDAAATAKVFLKLAENIK
jgi:DNA polymerase III epsilon subunit family exonuclease